ncbi:Uncharacterised protein [Neisseria lactamica]|uniref:Uncharacterized protein n=1 Tax=Neisseria lactamica TaxID=486 RepID=A0A378WB61_NEILA|nr:Uncharacterised protein [Neisseria lactamica]
MNHHGFDSGIDAAFVGDVSECNQTVQHIRIVGNQARGVEEHADLSVAYHATAFAAFAQNGGGNHVARLQFVNETLAQTVDQFGACGTHGFGNQRACQVRRMGNAGRMVLEGIDIAQFRARCGTPLPGRLRLRRSGWKWRNPANAAFRCRRLPIPRLWRAPTPKSVFPIVQNRADAAAVFVRQ